jgi:hypothetical protein
MENNPRSVNHHLMKKGGKLAGHTAAVILGVILMVIGLSMGVSMVMLPVGIPIGLAGVLIFLWGLFGTSAKRPSTPLKN